MVLLDAAEGALHEVDQALLKLGGACAHIPVLADVRDPVALAAVFKRHTPDIIFHAAAFKHVPLMERNPFSVIANNALGSQTLFEAAVKHGCGQIIMVSTDKAVEPLSLMGASKRIAELVLLAAATTRTSVKAVRLGNVLGSTGSVGPLFLQQLADGGPITVSHPEARRYFMTTGHAVAALLQAISNDCPSGILVPELGDPIRILDLARYLVARNKSLLNQPGGGDDVPIVHTSLRPGDKMEEVLLSSRESYAGTSSGCLRGMESPVPRPEELASAFSDMKQAVLHRDLPCLLQAVLRVVPEYRPSALLLQQATAATEAGR